MGLPITRKSGFRGHGIWEEWVGEQGSGVACEVRGVALPGIDTGMLVALAIVLVNAWYGVAAGNGWGEGRLTLIALKVIAAVAFLAIAAWWTVGAVRTWRGVQNFSSHPIFRVQRSQRKQNIDRCVAAVAAVLVFAAAIFTGAIFISANSTETPKPLQAVIAVSFVGLVLATACSILIRSFNKPRFLVPPGFRSAAGVHSRGKK
jgi:amino acid permease